MTIARYFEGLAILLAVLAAAGLIALATRRRFFPHWHGAQARLAEITVGIALIVMLSELLGLLHAFNRAGLLIASALLIAGGWRYLRRVPVPDSQPSQHDGRPAALGPWGALVAAGSAILVTVQWAIQAIPAIQHGMFEVDTLDYHLPMALRWAQTAQIGPIHQTVPGLPVGYYPANAEIFHALGMVAWQSDVFSLVLNLGWLLLALLAAWVIGRHFQAIPLSMAGTALVLAVPIMARNQPGSAMTDVPSMAFLLVAVALLDPRSIRSSDSRMATFALGGLAAGLALGTKLTVLPMLGLFALGIPFLVRESRWRTLAAWAGGAVAGGGFWYVRNLVVVGNPMPANRLPFGPLGLPVPAFRQFDTANQSVLHYATNTAILREYARDLDHVLGPAWIPFLLVSLAGLVLAVLRRRDRLLQLWGTTSLLGLLVYLATPTTAGGPEGRPLLFAVDLRYALPMLSVGFVLLAACLAGRGRLTVAAEAGVGLLLAATVAARWHIPGAPTQRRTLTVLAAAAVLAIAALIWWGRHQHLRPFAGARTRTRVRRIGIVGIVGAAASALLLGPAGAAFAGYSQEHRYAGASTDPAQSVYAWFQHLPSDQRIATTGLALAYPLSGPRLTSRITYLGADIKGALDDYSSCQAWTAAIAGSHVNYLVTGPLLPGSTTEPPASTWAQHDPAFAQVFKRGAIRVFSVVAAASPRSCR